MKKIIIFVMLFLLCGCKTKLEEPVTLTIYTLDYCGHCEAFQEKAVPYLQKRFEQFNVIYKDLDEHRKEYDAMIESLDQFDHTEYLSTPLIVYEDHFAIVGYEDQDEIAIYEDIVHSIHHEPLGKKLQAYRWEFK